MRYRRKIVLDKSINRGVARSANLINNYRLEEERPAQWRYFLGVILRRLTSPYQKGPLSTASCRPTLLAPFCVLYRPLLQPQDAMARLAVVAARTLAVPALTQL